MQKFKKLFFIIILLLLGIPLTGLPYICIDAGIPLLFNSEENSAPNPVILQGLGVTVPVLSFEIVFLETSILLFGTQYQYADDRAAPADWERANTLWVLESVMDLRMGANIDLGNSWEVGLSAGPAFFLRFPLFAFDRTMEEELIPEYQESMFAYFFGNGRFFMSSIEAAFRWQLYDNIKLCFKLRNNLPLFHIWDGEAVPFWDQMIIKGLIGIAIIFTQDE